MWITLLHTDYLLQLQKKLNFSNLLLSFNAPDNYLK